MTKKDNVNWKWRQISSSMLQVHWHTHIPMRGTNCQTRLWSWNLVYLFSMFWVKMWWLFTNSSFTLKKFRKVAQWFPNSLRIATSYYTNLSTGKHNGIKIQLRFLYNVYMRCKCFTFLCLHTQRNTVFKVYHLPYTAAEWRHIHK